MPIVNDSIDVAAYVTKECAQKNFFVNLTNLHFSIIYTYRILVS